MSIVAQFAIPLAVYGVGLIAMNRWWRRKLHESYAQEAAARRMCTALLDRLMMRGVRCEVCHEKFTEEQTATLRLGPGGYDVLAHALCVGPMPSE